MNIKKNRLEITLASGMMIASGNDDFELGGVDTKTIVDANGDPYIPGSSLKGKLRSLATLEERADIVTYFERQPQQQPQILFGDLLLQSDTQQPKFEIKFENTIDKCTKCATPRTNMRTSSGLTFSGYIMCQESGLKFVTILLKRLLYNFIGGQGSRGYGWIETITINGTTLEGERAADGQ